MNISQVIVGATLEKASVEGRTSRLSDIHTGSSFHNQYLFLPSNLQICEKIKIP